MTSDNSSNKGISQDRVSSENNQYNLVDNTESSLKNSSSVEKNDTYFDTLNDTHENCDESPENKGNQSLSSKYNLVDNSVANNFGDFKEYKCEKCINAEQHNEHINANISRNTSCENADINYAVNQNYTTPSSLVEKLSKTDLNSTKVLSDKAEEKQPNKTSRNQGQNAEPLNNSAKPQNPVAEPSNNSLAKSSLVMFAGTFVSRILGLVRSALLLATLGAFGAHDAFNVANTLPNTIFNLLAGGVLNAILVPQIVRAFRKKNGDEFVNRLLTTAATILLTITVLATAGSALLVSIFAYNMPAGWKALAVAFAFWCLPQIFFYGLYVLYGQVLNAKYSFGPYMWAPVLNNIISIAGLGVFIYFFGFASPNTTQQLSFWTFEKIMLIAGTGTLGVIAQALILIPIIKRTGFKLRLVWGVRGYGMKHTSKMALWAFGVVALSQVELLLISNIASSAQAYGERASQFIPSITVYSFAYLIYIIPQSLVTTSIITALFTKLSNQAASGENEQMSKDYMFTSTVLSSISIFASLTMMVLAVPLATLVGPSRPTYEIVAIAQVLAIMCICIPFQAFITINTRVLFAYEKTKNAFFFEIPRACILSLGAILIPYIFTPKYWVAGFCAVSCIAFVTVTFVQSLYLKHTFPIISYRYLLTNYLKEYLVMLFSAFVGLTISNLIFTSPVLLQGTLNRFSLAFIELSFIGTIMLVIYIAGLTIVKIPEIDSCINIVKQKLSVIRKK